MSLKNKMIQYIAPLSAKFGKTLSPEEIIFSYNQKLIPLVKELNTYKLPEQIIEPLFKIVIEGIDYIEQNEDQIADIINPEFIKFKQPALDAMFSLRWNIASLNKNDFGLVQNELTRIFHEYSYLVDQSIQIEFANKVVAPGLSAAHAADIQQLKTFGGVIQHIGQIGES